ncbi:MAG: translation initiation factor 2 [Oscillospiraceae bacterium]
MEEQKNRICKIVKSLPDCEAVNDIVLRIYVGIVQQKICDFCFREDMPIQLEGTAALMVVDLLKADAIIADSGKKVSSISRGDTTIQYGVSISENAAALIHGYESQLYRWRKLKPPRSN